MRATLSLSLLALSLAAAVPLQAQQHADHAEMAQHHPALVPDLVRAVETVREKLVGLAEAIPEEDYDWSPGEGVRSVGEVLMHVAADNYLLPTAAGVPAPASTGIVENDYPSVRAFETREATKAEAIQHLQASFDHFKAAMEGATQESMGEDLTIFTLELTGQQLWVMATTHVHEHLGQLIAYARMNGVVPPWSN